MEYRARITHEGTRTLAEFPDCPGCQTFAEKNESIEAMAEDALNGWLETHLLEARGAPPKPKTKEGLAVRVRLGLAVKLELRWARVKAGLTQGEVGKLAGVSQQMVAKVEHPDYSAGIDVLERVARALGCDLNIALQRIPKPKAVSSSRRLATV